MLSLLKNLTDLRIKPIELQPNPKNQPRCSCIRRLENEVRQARRNSKKDTDFKELHPSYGELERCARQGCRGCMVVRQALVLAQITGQQVEDVEKRDDSVYVRWQGGQTTGAGLPPKPTLQVTLGMPQKDIKTVSIAITTNIEVPRLPDTQFEKVVPQIKEWLDNCCKNHRGKCGNLSWSNENPKRLIEILSDSELRLIDTSRLAKVDYVALSYCWGPGQPEKTTTSTNLALRQDKFQMSEMPKTIQHALKLVSRLGLAYLWVDQVCIVQSNRTGVQRNNVWTNHVQDDGTQDGTDPDPGEWKLEASKMHIVYGNALFTLCACSSERSTDPLLWPRKAWTYPVSPFYFLGDWLVNVDMTLKEVRTRALLSTRGWTLQEERLSPRLLYFCGQRVYWSCFLEQRTELPAGGTAQNRPSARPFALGNEYGGLSEAQTFLGLRYYGDKIRLHREWLDLVEAYCLRNLTVAADRFHAISGLATQYLSVYRTKDNEIWDQEYLAGLWRKTFAEDLAWSVEKACDPHKGLPDLAPSWSWASLPLRTRIKTKQPIKHIEDFALLKESATHYEESSMSNSLKNVSLESVANSLDVCRKEAEKGAENKSVLVRGRVQKLMNTRFQQIDWSEIQIDSEIGDEYDISRYIDRHVYARNLENGKIVIYEPNKHWMEGQLDYLVPSGDVVSTGLKAQVYIPTGTERDLLGLQIGKETMLLLQSSEWPTHRRETKSTDRKSGDNAMAPSCCRVGICRTVGEAFFDGAELVDLVLV
ncbi:hypothetical protein PV05_07729 [Exophiala xenobiotica]|uniref:Heterokaryon incompatibility domain-containing protein n=1 Tax=Exophiala xenobiotica TaxID=348802 RepID=A0A0D2E9M3_9EURO|nr:uncharacterized protein PV05_07729 [Exophiala xenobiotica]KIW52058.1 hypothetical protein PV05_07729 [Exophiala xenobiotica]